MNATMPLEMQPFPSHTILHAEHLDLLKAFTDGERVNNANIPIGMPVARYQGAEYGAIVYGRGALFFVALRAEMGNEAFDAFLKEYTESLSWGIATPEYLQSLAEQKCACELDALFQEWVYP